MDSSIQTAIGSSGAQNWEDSLRWHHEASLRPPKYLALYNTFLYILIYSYIIFTLQNSHKIAKQKGTSAQAENDLPEALFMAHVRSSSRGSWLLRQTLEVCERQCVCTVCTTVLHSVTTGTIMIKYIYDQLCTRPLQGCRSNSYLLWMYCRCCPPPRTLLRPPTPHPTPQSCDGTDQHKHIPKPKKVDDSCYAHMKRDKKRINIYLYIT